MVRGILAVVAASIFFGLVPSANKFVLLSGMTSDCIVFYMTLAMIATTALVLILKKESPRMNPSLAVKLLALGAIGMGGTDYFLDQAYVSLPVSVVVMLHFLYPSIVLVIMVAGFHHHLSASKIGAVLFSILGLVLISNTSGGLDAAGAAYAIGSACTYAFFVIANDYGEIRQQSLIVKLFYVSIGASIAIGPGTLASGHLSAPVGWSTALMLFGGVGLGTLLAFYLVTVGIRHIGAERAAFFNMLEPITGVLIGAAAYHETLTAKSIIGCVCVLLSVLFIAFDGYREYQVQLQQNFDTDVPV